MQKRILALSWSVAAFACVSLGAKPLPSLAPLDAKPAPIALSASARQARLTALVFDLPMGHRFGQSSWGEGACYRREELVNSDGRVAFDVEKYADVFNGVMRARGYSVEDSLELFRDTKERVADLKVAGRVIDATINECYPAVVSNKLKVKGSAHLRIEWSVYANLDKKVVLVTTTEGSTYREIESSVGQMGLLRAALADAVERLASAEAYRAVVDPPAATVTAPPERGRIKIKRARAYSGGLKSNLEGVRRAVLTVTANKGSGSGFVLSEDGKVLTAAHVVAGSKFAKVTTSAGVECYGEVVASSKQRDLALISVECAGLTPLPLGREPVVEGSEVFAIGTPLSDKLSFSVTKGVVSGIRTLDALDYIQSDVTLLPGGSGGPLLDASGNAIGVATSGITTNSIPVGVNFFVPLSGIEKHLPIALE